MANLSPIFEGFNLADVSAGEYWVLCLLVRFTGNEVALESAVLRDVLDKGNQ
jgi:hypothetical protein